MKGLPSSLLVPIVVLPDGLNGGAMSKPVPEAPAPMQINLGEEQLTQQSLQQPCEVGPCCPHIYVWRICVF